MRDATGSDAIALLITDMTAHALACGSIGAQRGRPRLHTVMEVACCTLLSDLDPSLIVLDSRDAYPHDHGFAVNASTPDVVVQLRYLRRSTTTLTRVSLIPTKTGQKTLIYLNFTNAAGKSGKNGFVNLRSNA